MKIIMNILSIIMIVWMSMGCGKEPMPSPCKLPDCSDTIKWVFKQADSLGVMPILWYKVAHAPDTSASHQWCFATEDGVILVNQIQDGYNFPYVRFLDRQTGEEKWYWDGLKSDYYSDIQYISERNLLMVKQGNKNAILNTKTGEVLMNTSLPQEAELLNSPKGRILGEYFYTSIMKRQNDSKNTIDYSTVMRTRIDDGNSWEKLYTLYDNEIAGYTPDFNNTELWMHPNTGDSILLINNRLFHWENYQIGKPFSTLERSDVIAYNLSKRKVEWTIDSICKVSSIGTQFLLDRNFMYFHEGDQLTKIDLLNPQKKLYSYFRFGGHGVIDRDNNRIIGQSLGLSSCALDHYQVNWKWSNDDFGSNGLELFEGYIYTADEHGDLYVINATTGKIVFQEYSLGMLPNSYILGMRGRASVDRKHRLLYCSDLWGTYCLKLPERWE